jgi:hypothetical protein
MDKNPERAIKLISGMGLWDVIPITESLQPYLPKKTAQIKRNFDIGENVFSNLDQNKSILDFRKKRLTNRKKKLKNIKRIKFP